jgi:iron complex transport system substrate-binding protein
VPPRVRGARRPFAPRLFPSERTGFLFPIAPLALALCVLLLAGCGRADDRAGAEAPPAAITVTDDAGRVTRLERPARRVIALMPSATETLLALGARGQIVGRTDFDRDPAVAALPSVGGGLDPSLEQLVALRPDLVIGWETEKPQLRERLLEMGIPVFAVRTTDTTDVFRAIGNLGRLTGHSPAADSLAARIRGELEAVRASVAGLPRRSVFFIVWNDPPMTVGPGTFVAQLIGVAGGRSLFPEARQPWPTVSLEEVVRRQPEVVLVPVGESGAPRMDVTGPGWRELSALRERGPALLPADLVNRPGPRLGEAARRIRDAIHPERAGR